LRYATTALVRERERRSRGRGSEARHEVYHACTTRHGHYQVIVPPPPTINGVCYVPNACQEAKATFKIVRREI